MSDGRQKTVLLTLGRLPKALELARALKGAGCRVLVAEPFSRHLCKASNAVDQTFQTPSPHTDQAAYLDCLLDIVVRAKVDLIVPVSEEALHVSLLEPRLPDGCTLFSLPHEALCTLHDKYTFAQTVFAAGLPVPDTYQALDPRAAQLARRTETVFKPRLGCSGQSMALLTPDTVSDRHFQDPEALLQERVFGHELSTLTLCHRGEILAHVTYRGLVLAGTVAVCFERVDTAPQVKDWVEAFVRAGRYSHFLAVDFIVDKDGQPWPLECNPRLTSGLHFFAPEALARAVLAYPEHAHDDLKPGTRFQEGHTTLLQVYASLFRPQTFLQRLRALATSRDVLWSRGDPLPFPLMTPYSWPVLKQVLFQGRSFGEAATRDIAWPPDPARSAQPLETPKKAVSAHGT